MLSSPFKPSKMIMIFFSELNLWGVLCLIALTTDLGLLLVLGSFRPSFQNLDYNLKPSLYYTLILSISFETLQSRWALLSLLQHIDQDLVEPPRVFVSDPVARLFYKTKIQVLVHFPQ